MALLPLQPLLCAGLTALSLSQCQAKATPTFLDRKLSPAPKVVSGSAAMVRASLVPFVHNANVSNSDDWGIPVVRASPGDPKRTIALKAGGYGSSAKVTFRVPDWAVPSRGSDHHLAVVDGANELDIWDASRLRNHDLAGSARVVTGGSPVPAPIAATASGFALTAGLITPEDLASGQIRHALAFTTPNVRNSFVAPAVHGDGPSASSSALPMGTLIQLDPRVDVSGLPKAERIIAVALQQYGAYLVDTGGSLALRAESSLGRRGGGGTAWADAGVTDPTLRDIPWGRMRVLAPPAAR